MSSDLGSNPQIPTESKSARKKKAKAEVAAVPAKTTSEHGSSSPAIDAQLNGADGSSEHAYIRELQK